jgi:nitrogen fixation NifU-like protein
VSSEALYHEALVRLARAATGAGRLTAPDGSAVRDNPLCGDRVTFDVRVHDGCIAAVAHQVRGCLLCEAAAALLGQAAPGAAPGEVGAARAAAAALLTAGAPAPDGRWAELEKFVPVGQVPSRHGCVLLPFAALEAALAAALDPARSRERG